MIWTCEENTWERQVCSSRSTGGKLLAGRTPPPAHHHHGDVLTVSVCRHAGCVEGWRVRRPGARGVLPTATCCPILCAPAGQVPACLGILVTQGNTHCRSAECLPWVLSGAGFFLDYPGRVLHGFRNVSWCTKYKAFGGWQLGAEVEKTPHRIACGVCYSYRQVWVMIQTFVINSGLFHDTWHTNDTADVTGTALKRGCYQAQTTSSIRCDSWKERPTFWSYLPISYTFFFFS